MRIPKIFKRILHIQSEENEYDTRTIWKNCSPSDPILHESNQQISNKVKTSRYTLWNFLPISLFQQFQKLVNIYFGLLIIGLLILGSRTPVSPATTILPLLFVITITCIKQAYEDYQRHKSDRVVNSRVVEILENDCFVKKPAESLQLGDIVKVYNDEEFPCDLVILSSSNSNGTCYITTVTFDGETNLKLRYSISDTMNLSEPDSLNHLSCSLEYDLPNHELYKFNGRFTLFSRACLQKNVPLSLDNFLLRGAQLRNTSFIIGIAAYTGQDTKMALNQRKKRRKMSVVDHKLNHFILLMIVILALGSSIVTLMHYFLPVTAQHWYLDKKFFELSVYNVFIDTFTFLALLNNLIPVSLYVTIELQKFFNSLFIDWDLNMYHVKTDDPARTNTSDTLEELGQVEYIFSDKTGTITENKMSFNKCCIGSIVYTKKDEYIYNIEKFNASNMNLQQLMFFTHICLCHSAEVDLTISTDTENRKKSKYMSPSSDEVALLDAAETFGFVFKGRDGTKILIDMDGISKEFYVQAIMEFDPTRKRMSVIVTDTSGKHLLICKGADSHVLPLCKQADLRDIISAHVNNFASEGLRTLVFAYKEFTESEFKDATLRIKNAALCVLNRDEELKVAYEMIETDLTVIGASAVDDQLQHGVTQTIAELRAAGIKIWILTGDKEETAVNISFKCGHLTQKMRIIRICNLTENINKTALLHCKTINESKPEEEFALIIDGSTFKIIINEHPNIILKIFSRCNTVVCCRMSPIQKSQVVSFVRTHMPHKPITLAIGDGANDCSMIQEADVGVGIMGREGRQAVYSSDFAIHRFRYLSHLLLVHGFNFYTRIVGTIHYFFYKNILLCAPMYLFVWYTKFSPSSLYEDAELTMYNTLITSLPILLYGVFEQLYPRKILLSRPEIYKTITRNNPMGWRYLVLWLLNGLWQSLVVFYWCKFVYNGGLINIPEQYVSYTLFGTMIFTYVIILATFQIQLFSRYWTLHTVVTTLGSLLYYIIGASFVSLLYSFDSTSGNFSSQFNSYYIFFLMLSKPYFWYGFFTIIPIALFPYFLAQFISHLSQSTKYNPYQRHSIPITYEVINRFMKNFTLKSNS